MIALSSTKLVGPDDHPTRHPKRCSLPRHHTLGHRLNFLLTHIKSVRVPRADRFGFLRVPPDTFPSQFHPRCHHPKAAISFTQWRWGLLGRSHPTRTVQEASLLGSHHSCCIRDLSGKFLGMRNRTGRLRSLAPLGLGRSSCFHGSFLMVSVRCMCHLGHIPSSQGAKPQPSPNRTCTLNASGSFNLKQVYLDLFLPH